MDLSINPFIYESINLYNYQHNVRHACIICASSIELAMKRFRVIQIGLREPSDVYAPIILNDNIVNYKVCVTKCFILFHTEIDYKISKMPNFLKVITKSGAGSALKIAHVVAKFRLMKIDLRRPSEAHIHIIF